MRLNAIHYCATNSIRTAFTIVELLVVIVVLGIVAAVVIPGGRAADDARLLSAARLLAADLDHARVESFGSAADRCLIVFDQSGTGYHLARTSAPDTPLQDAVTGRVYRRTYGLNAERHFQGVTIDPAGAGGDYRLGFTGAGRIDQSFNADLVVRYGAQSVTVTVDAGTGDAAIAP